jgi:hypothetical protein
MTVEKKVSSMNEDVNEISKWLGMHVDTLAWLKDSDIYQKINDIVR